MHTFGKPNTAKGKEGMNISLAKKKIGEVEKVLQSGLSTL